MDTPLDLGVSSVSPTLILPANVATNVDTSRQGSALVPPMHRIRRLLTLAVAASNTKHHDVEFLETAILILDTPRRR